MFLPDILQTVFHSSTSNKMKHSSLRGSPKDPFFLCKMFVVHREQCSLCAMHCATRQHSTSNCSTHIVHKIPLERRALIGTLMLVEADKSFD